MRTWSRVTIRNSTFLSAKQNLPEAYLKLYSAVASEKYFQAPSRYYLIRFTFRSRVGDIPLFKIMHDHKGALWSRGEISSRSWKDLKPRGGGGGREWRPAVIFLTRTSPTLSAAIVHELRQSLRESLHRMI